MVAILNFLSDFETKYQITRNFLVLFQLLINGISKTTSLL